MSQIRIESVKVKNYRSFWEEQSFVFPWDDYKKPVAIVGYNNAGKTNLMNAILYGIGEKYVGKDTFTIDDFHNRNIENIPWILLKASSSSERKYDNKEARLEGYHRLLIQTDGQGIEWAKIQSLNSLVKKTDYNGHEKDDENWQAFGANRYFNIFYINFHTIKDEISTQKSSWGNLKSFLGRHIKKIVDWDTEMAESKPVFKAMVESATNFVIWGSQLETFIGRIKSNYSQNLRDNNCEVQFWLPDYEDIFLQMIFKIGLNGSMKNMVPITHFWDGYISMFVMAVIQAIAESETDDKCLFLFEEPESFLHENHQEYFYKTVLCGLSEKGHQVIYTTHSDRMVDIFDTRSIIRLEFDEVSKQTVTKYNNPASFSPSLAEEDGGGVNPITLTTYNAFIRSVEPNLNKILFGRKVVLVEWPNDLMAYRYALERKIMTMWKDRRFAETYLNFHNISIVPHHGKSTALLLILLCRHLWVEYFVINDWDLSRDFIDELAEFSTENDMKTSDLYRDSEEKWTITTNWKLLREARQENIHFNVPRLEGVLGWTATDKDSLKLWKHLESMTTFPDDFFPEALERFLEIWGRISDSTTGTSS